MLVNLPCESPYPHHLVGAAPALLADDEQEIRRANSQARKRVRYGEPGYRTRYL